MSVSKFRLRVTLTTEDDPGGVTLFTENMTQAEADQESRRLVRLIAKPTRASIELIDLQGRVVNQRRRA